MTIDPNILRKIKEVVFLKNEPPRTNVLWAKYITANTYSFYFFFDGAWHPADEITNVTISTFSGTISAFVNDVGYITFQDISGKVDKVEGKGLSTNDFTDEDKAKLNSALQKETDPTVHEWAKQSVKPTYTAQEVGALPDTTVIPAAQVNSDWNATSGVAQILNKPEIPELPEVGPDAAGREYVDLGLPSGTLWATMNVGATSETDAGLYFQWGDTQGYTADQVGSGEGKKYFSWNDYKWTNDSGSTMSKYNATDGKTVLDLEDDAVAANWGGDWHMPTEADFQELLDNTDKSWTTVNNVSGYKFAHKNDSSKYIFIPAAGSASNGSMSYVGSYGRVWSSSLFTSNVKRGLYLDFGSRSVSVSNNLRSIGCSVRGVLDPSATQLHKVAVTGDYNDLENKPTIPTVPTNVSAFDNDAGYLTQHQDISGKEDVTTIITPVNEEDATLPITALTCEVGKYYRIDVPIETLGVTLPAMTDGTTVRTVVLYLTGGTTPAVTITSTAVEGSVAPDVYYQDGYEIEAGKTYEVNCLWNGNAWIVVFAIISNS